MKIIVFSLIFIVTVRSKCSVCKKKYQILTAYSLKDIIAVILHCATFLQKLNMPHEVMIIDSSNDQAILSIQWQNWQNGRIIGLCEFRRYCHFSSLGVNKHSLRFRHNDKILLLLRVAINVKLPTTTITLSYVSVTVFQ